MQYSSDVDLHRMGSCGSSGDEAQPKYQRGRMSMQGSTFSNQLYNTLVSLQLAAYDDSGWLMPGSFTS